MCGGDPSQDGRRGKQEKGEPEARTDNTATSFPLRRCFLSLFFSRFLPHSQSIRPVQSRAAARNPRFLDSFPPLSLRGALTNTCARTTPFVGPPDRNSDPHARRTREKNRAGVDKPILFFSKPFQVGAEKQEFRSRRKNTARHRRCMAPPRPRAGSPPCARCAPTRG